MCDTFVILAPHTTNGNTIFGKNSDRDPDEAQNVIFLPGGETNASEVRCTYISIPQVKETYDVILSKPFWMWGGEMGVNQFGVTIGNEAVFTNEPLNEIGLLGMDMIRIALERTKTAKRALDLIIELLETYGQGGGCGYHDRSMNYHNSWIIADSQEAYVLETAGKYWVWKKVEKNYSISNILTISNDYDEISDGAIENAIEKGKCSSKTDFSFSDSYTATGLNMQAILGKAGKGKDRRMMHYSKTCKLTENKEASVQNCMEVLRSHQPSSSEYEPSRDGSNADVCWHAAGFLRPSQSTNSFVVEIDEELTTVWTTCGSSPCIQLYRPFVLSQKISNSIPEIIKPGQKIYDPNATWWKNELLHREVLKDYGNRLNSYKEDRDFIEDKWINELREMMEFQDMKIYTDKAAEKANILIEEWTKRVKNIDVRKKPKWTYRRFWNNMNEKNKIPARTK